MDKLIGFCGLVCSECPAFIATQNDDDIERKRIAKEWTKQHKHAFKIQDINCDGCLSKEGRHIGYCSMCEIRACATEKAVKNCAHCENYICEKLRKFFDMSPQAKESLEKIRKSL